MLLPTEVFRRSPKSDFGLESGSREVQKGGEKISAADTS